MIRPTRSIAALAALLFVAACSSSTEPDDTGDPGGGSATGSLQVTINGLGSGVAGGLTVTGPGGFTRTVTVSENLTGLAVGSYEVAAVAVSGAGVAYEPAQVTQTVTVTGDASTTVVVDYVAQLGGLQVTVLGVPTGATADVTVTGPNAYSATVTSSQTLADLPVGDYAVTVGDITAGSDLYEGSADASPVSVTFGATPGVTVQYQIADGTLELTIDGLPGGVSADIVVSGPGSFSAAVTGSTTLTGLAAGDYTIDASSVVDGPDSYSPTPTSQTISVAGGGTGSATVTYSTVALVALDGKLSTGSNHTCGIDAVGAVNCWGLSNQGQTGTGAQEVNPVTSPNAAAAGPFEQVVAAFEFTCARQTDGTTFCWGSNFYGETGVGAPLGVVNDPTLTPTELTGHSFSTISASPDAAHACGLDATGAAWCWGDNRQGQLGDGTTTTSNVPVAAAAGFTFTEISVRFANTCALDATGILYCWGRDAEWTFSTPQQSTAPVEQPGNVTYAALAQGGLPCGLTAAGQAYCWGPQRLDFGVGFNGIPALQAGGQSFVQLIGGVASLCALDGAGTAYCWGSNAIGQLGDGTSVSSRMTAEPVAGGHIFDQLAPGGESHHCAVDTSGARWCWGRNTWGQLGTGDTMESSVPVAVISF
jgi:alpha-tubulin suppressor-like RCC1 family protein